jgi:hypothetical protein
LTVNSIYILSEDENDENFYNLCVEKIKAQGFQLVPIRLRKASGIAKVRRNLPWLVNQVSHYRQAQQVFFVIALDNDRSPTHPDHQRIPHIAKLPKKEQTRPCRFCELEKVLHEILGRNRSQWSIKGAIAVPVQMLESWLLLICNPSQYQNEAALPYFAEKSQPIAQRYYAPHPPGPQLKDLKAIEKSQLGLTSEEDFCLHCIDKLAPGDLAAIAPSFELFKRQIDAW